MSKRIRRHRFPSKGLALIVTFAFCAVLNISGVSAQHSELRQQILVPDETDTGDSGVVPGEPPQRPQPIAKNDSESLVAIISLGTVLVLSGASYGILAAVRRKQAADKKDVV